MRTPMRFRGWMWAFAVCLAGAREASAAPRVEFNRDIRPILSDNCYQCHGPDAAKRQAELRLDTEAGAKADLGGRSALVPAKLDESELYQRLIAEDADERMPPRKSGKMLTAQQIELIRLWIEQGAEWQPHWSFVPPIRAVHPALKRAGEVRNPIDPFVASRLEHEGLSFAPEADRTTLIRRVSLDLTGLPPTPAEVDDFLADDSPAAFDKVVDRLLASPRFGERMAVRWLDGARYADTSGYQTDGERHMWRWRDWVIDAYNSNMPFDQFTVEQLAGDMLPQATLDQQIASGFNRNHRQNSEGGIIPEEYAVEYVVDRVETTFTVWMGLTMGCGRCHDHKFDPLTQREFYQAFAYFNNVPEYGRAMKYGNSPPMIKAPTREQSQRHAALGAQLLEAQAAFDLMSAEIAAAQTGWEQTLDRTRLAEKTVDRGQLLHRPLEPTEPPAEADRFEGGDPAYAPGRSGMAVDFDGRRFLNAGDVGDFGFLDKFSLAAWVLPRGDKGGTIVSRMTDVDQGDGYSLALKEGKLQFNLVKRWLDDALRVETERALAPDEWQHVLVSYDGSRQSPGVTFYVNGRPEPKRVLVDLLNQPFTPKAEPFRIGGGHGPDGRFHGLIDEVRVFGVPLTPDEARILSTAETLAEIAAIPRDARSSGQSAKLQAFFIDQIAPTAIRDSHHRVVELRLERDKLYESFPDTMVMQELPVPRETHILIRGEYNKPGDLVSAGMPACLPGISADLPPDRLGLARWLVSPEHPLTARVAANRLWQMLFGNGLVKTVDDFGAQGEWPTHPELLDWLAVEFMSDLKSQISNPKSAWDVKRLLRLLVTSATYRQSSRASPELLQHDPENRLMARGPRLRLSAEMVRDQALAAAGLLVDRPGGPSVKPYQPDGLWKELSDTDYAQDHGEGLYRRGMYTFWKRTVPPPTMITFDSAGRETCIVRETRTNTPLQALTLMNDVTFVEAARALAQRAMKESGATPVERLTHAFRLTVSRSPRPDELRVLLSGWEAQRDRFLRDPAAAEKLLSQGESPRDASLDPAELAAYTTLAGVILNLDETITKE